MNIKSDFGFYVEHLVARFLQKKGYEILDTNFRRKWGEVDIVARKAGVLVFIEVKASREEIPGFEPERRAGKEKMAKVLRTAKTYMAYKKIQLDTEWQLDVVAATYDKSRGTINIKHFKNVSV